MRVGQDISVFAMFNNYSPQAQARCEYLPVFTDPGANNGPFSSSPVPLFQSESKCETVLMKMTLICMKMKLHTYRTHFHIKGFALRLVLN